jgi:hypothetical protein
MSTISAFAPIGKLAPPVPGLPDQADLNPLLTRTHYFDGRLLTAADLTRDQKYLDHRLREIGQALGSGVARGLGATLQGGRILLEPGIAVTPAGRVLEVQAPLTLDLNDRAGIATLNQGAFANLPRGLYALVLGYTEAGQGIAEVFPEDLAGRTVQYDVYLEGVQASLVLLPLALPQMGQLAVRAALIRTLAEGVSASGLIPEDAVALGILGVRDNLVEWLDTTLLRHPVRTAPGPGDLQQDMHRQYEALLADVLAARSRSDGDFAASDYFRALPPTGRVPKGAIDPVAGRQRYFPEHFRVSIAPVRLSDLALVQRESMALPAIDLSRDEPVDLVVLAPLPAEAFARLAGALERRPSTTETGGSTLRPAVLLPHLDLLRLRLYPLRPVHEVNTDAAAWQALWAEVGDRDPVFVRRPTRAAETGLSAVRIARGTEDEELPPPDPEDLEPFPSDRGGLVLDADAVLLERLGFEQLAALRPPPDGDAEAVAARDTLIAELGDRARTVLDCVGLMLVIERRFDPLLWQTLLFLAQRDLLTTFAERLRAGQQDSPTGEAAATALEDLGPDTESPPPALIDRWRELDDAA